MIAIVPHRKLSYFMQVMRYGYLTLIIFIFITLCATAAFADEMGEGFKLGLPADCTLGSDCWVVNYLDVDPSDKAQDFQCGPRSYNNHKGVDIAIADRVAMEKGVNVVAAADGTVLRFRDGEKDWPALDTAEIISARKALFDGNKGCGNGVFIDHGDGWMSIYCHMKQGSIVVKRDQKVKAGDILGQIGQSGFAEFPHVHIGIYKGEEVIDPFTGHNAEDGCGHASSATPLWSDALALTYDPVIFYAAGFKNGAPRFDAIKIDASSPESYPNDIAAFTFWVALYGVNKGDQIDLEVRDPFGLVYVRREIMQEHDRARQFYFVGKKVHEPLKKGHYEATATLTRYVAGVAPIRRKITREIEIR